MMMMKKYQKPEAYVIEFYKSVHMFLWWIIHKLVYVRIILMKWSWTVTPDQYVINCTWMMRRSLSSSLITYISIYYWVCLTFSPSLMTPALRGSEKTAFIVVTYQSREQKCSNSSVCAVDGRWRTSMLLLDSISYMLFVCTGRDVAVNNKIKLLLCSINQTGQHPGHCAPMSQEDSKPLSGPKKRPFQLRMIHSTVTASAKRHVGWYETPL